MELTGLVPDSCKEERCAAKTLLYLKASGILKHFVLYQHYSDSPFPLPLLASHSGIQRACDRGSGREDAWEDSWWRSQTQLHWLRQNFVLKLYAVTVQEAKKVSFLSP